MVTDTFYNSLSTRVSYTETFTSNTIDISFTTCCTI